MHCLLQQIKWPVGSLEFLRNAAIYDIFTSEKSRTLLRLHQQINVKANICLKSSQWENAVSHQPYNVAVFRDFMMFDFLNFWELSRKTNVTVNVQVIIKKIAQDNKENNFEMFLLRLTLPETYG